MKTSRNLKARGALKILWVLVMYLLVFSPWCGASEAKRHSIQLSGIKLNSLVTYLSMFEKKPVLLDQHFPKNEIVSVVSTSNSNLTNEELFKIVKGILQSRGWAIIKDEAYLQIIPLKEAITLAQPVGDKKPDGTSQFISKVITLKYGKAQTVAQALQKHKSDQGMITYAGNANKLLITDYAPTVERIEEIVSQIDVAPLRPETKYVKLQNIRVENLVPIVSDYISSLTGTDATAKKVNPNTMSANSIKITTDIRSNSLVVIGMPQEVQKVLDLIAQIDKPVNREKNIHIYKVKYGDPRYLWSVLTGETFSTDQDKLGTVQGGAESGTSSTAKLTRGSVQLTTGLKEVQGLTTTTIESGTTKYVSAKVKVVADLERSCLLIYGPEEEYRQIEEILDRLDRPKKQVHLETAIVEMTDEKSRALGVEYGYLDSPGTGNMGPFATLSNNLSNLAYNSDTGNYAQYPTLAGSGLLSVGVFWEDVLSIPMLIQMSETDGDIDILARPTLTTDNHKQAMIDISEENPIAKKTTSDNGDSTYTIDDYISVGTTLTLTPHVNDENLIRLQVFQTISEFSNTATTSEVASAGGKNTYRRSADTELTVPNGKMAVIGGLIKEKVEQSEYGVPGLKKIPVLGSLFRSRSIKKTKTNLCIFITPNVIDDTERFMAKSKKRYKDMRKCMTENDLDLFGGEPKKSTKCKSLGEKGIFDPEDCECESMPILQDPCVDTGKKVEISGSSNEKDDLRPMTEAEFEAKYGYQFQSVNKPKPQPVERVIEPVGPQRQISNLSQLRPGETYSAAELSTLSFGDSTAKSGAIVIEE